MDMRKQTCTRKWKEMQRRWWALDGFLIRDFIASYSARTGRGMKLYQRDRRTISNAIGRPTDQSEEGSSCRWKIWSLSGRVNFSFQISPSILSRGKMLQWIERERAVCSDGVRWWGQRVAEAEAMMFESIVGVFFKWRRLYVRILSSKTSFKRCPFSSLYRKFRSRSLIVELPCCLVRTGRQNCGPWWREMVILLISAPISCGSTHAIR